MKYDVRVFGGAEQEAAALGAAEQRREDRLAVDSGQAQPHDFTAGVDQRGGAGVAQ